MNIHSPISLLVRASAVCLLAAAGFGAHAQLVLSANDGKVTLVDGVMKTVEGTDTLSVIDLSSGIPKVTARIDVPTSIVGPPMAVDVTRDRKLALVTAAFVRKADEPMAATVAADIVTIVDLTTNPPSIVGTAQAGLGAAGVSINREGTLALVANRNEGTISVFSIQGHTLTPLDKIALGDAKSGPSHVMFTPDGKTALVTRDGDHRISVLAIDGNKVKATGRDMFAGQRPYGLDITSRGDVAVIGNIGQGQGDADTVSLIDLTLTPPRVVHTVTVGATPEGIALSADGRYVGVTVINGSNKPRASSFFDEHGKFILLRIDNKRLVPVAEALVGAWPQGVAFSNDGHRVLVQSALRKEIQVLAIDNEKITDTGIRLPMDGAPASIRAIR